MTSQCEAGSKPEISRFTWEFPDHSIPAWHLKWAMNSPSGDFGRIRSIAVGVCVSADVFKIGIPPNPHLFERTFAPPETDLLPVLTLVLTFGVVEFWIGKIKTQAVSPRSFDRLSCRTTVNRWLLRKGLRHVDRHHENS